MSRTPKPIVLHCSVGDGKLEVTKHQWQQIKLALKGWPNTPAILKIKPYEETRRARANAYYWGVVLKLMAEESGHSPDEIHELMKLRHNSHLIADLNGEEQRVPKSTAKLTISEFSDYLEAVMLDGSEHLGIVFPEPHSDEEWRA